MKNILAKLGSKKVMGAVLVMVTLVVGLGVISNFSDSEQKRANEVALSNFTENSYNNFYGSAASRADLERQISLGQDKNTARFFRGQSDGMDDDAFSSDGAYGEGLRTDEGFVYGDVDYGPGGASYGQGPQGATGIAGFEQGVPGQQGAAGVAGSGQDVQGSQAVAGFGQGSVPGIPGEAGVPGEEGIMGMSGESAIASAVGAAGAGVKGGRVDGSSDASNSKLAKGGVRGSYDPAKPMHGKGVALDENGVPYAAADASAVVSATVAGDLKGSKAIKGAKGDSKVASAAVAGDSDGAEGRVSPQGRRGKTGNGSGSTAEATGVAAGGEAGGAAADAGGAGSSKDAAAQAAAEAAAKAAAKAEKAKQKRNRMRRETQINKLANSGGGSSWSGISGGGNFGGYALPMLADGDNSRKPLPGMDKVQGNNTDIDAFRMGRGGAMGGYNVSTNGMRAGEQKRDGSMNPNNQLLYANKASLGAVGKKVSTGMKAMAEDAFIQDGSTDPGSLIEDGATIERAASKLADPAINPGAAGLKDVGGGGLGVNLEEKREELEKLQSDWKDKFWNMILRSLWLSVITAIMAIVAKALMKVATPPWVAIVGIILYILAVLLALTNIAFIWEDLFGFQGGGPADDSLIGLTRQMASDELNPVNADLKWYYKEWLSWTSGGVLGVIAVLSLFSSSSTAAAAAELTTSEAIGAGIAAFVTGLLGVAGGGGAIDDIVKQEDERDKNGEGPDDNNTEGS